MNIIELSIMAGLLAAQAPPYRGPPVVYVPPGYQQAAPPPVYRVPAAPVQQPRALSRDEERNRIIDWGEDFCRRYADDRVCHPR
jgi:hypothetical protein